VPLRTVAPESRPELSRGQTAVCIPVYGAADLFFQCVRSVLAHTPVDVPILIADDASTDPAILEFLEDLDRRGSINHVVWYVRQEQNRGFVENMNAAFAILAPADVVTLNSDCVVAASWFDRLRAAALSDRRIATVSVLSNNGTILSVPNRNRSTDGLSQDWEVDHAAEAVAQASQLLRPQIPTGIGHCLYVRRSALDLVGYFDTGFSPGYGEEVDFSQRCLLRGLSHVVADDVFVLHRGAASFRSDGEGDTRKQANDAVVAERYAYYSEWVQAESSSRVGPLSRSIGNARRALCGLSVTIDARCLTEFVTGTQLHTLELISALEEPAGIRVRVIVPPNPGTYAQQMLAALPDLEVVAASDIHAATERTDVVHRPFQVNSVDDVRFLSWLGDRTVVTQQDLIAYSNPGYFPSYRRFAEYRDLTRQVLGAADRVLFFSNHAASEALAAELVDRDRAQVVYLGTDHQLARAAPAPVPPRGSDAIGQRPFLLCLGTDFRHKNRLFALRLIAALRERQGWDGALVFAGAKVNVGSSAGDEAAFLAAHPELEQHVVRLAAVDEAGKAWLMARATALLYPSVYEGFGLGPYEAADAGIPCLFAAQSALAEFLPDAVATIVPWDADATADRAAPLIVEGVEREAHVAAIRAASARLTWARTGRELVAAYETAAQAPGRCFSELVVENGGSRERVDQAEKLTAEYESWAKALDQHLTVTRGALDHDALALVGPDGSLPRDLIRPLLAITNRRWLRIPLTGLVRVFYWPVYLLLHRQLPERKQLSEAPKSADEAQPPRTD